MDAPSFKTVIIYAAVVCTCQMEMACKAAAEDLIENLCGGDLNPDYSSQAMRNTAALVDAIPTHGYNAHTSSSFSFYGETFPYWGHGACNGEVNSQQCSDCLTEALYDLNRCYGTTGGQVKLTNCRLRYEMYEFDLNW